MRHVLILCLVWSTQLIYAQQAIVDVHLSHLSVHRTLKANDATEDRIIQFIDDLKTSTKAWGVGIGTNLILNHSIYLYGGLQYYQADFNDYRGQIVTGIAINDSGIFDTGDLGPVVLDFFDNSFFYIYRELSIPITVRKYWSKSKVRPYTEAGLICGREFSQGSNLLKVQGALGVEFFNQHSFSYFLELKHLHQINRYRTAEINQRLYSTGVQIGFRYKLQKGELD